MKAFHINILKLADCFFLSLLLENVFFFSVLTLYLQFVKSLFLSCEMIHAPRTLARKTNDLAVGRYRFAYLCSRGDRGMVPTD